VGGKKIIIFLQLIAVKTTKYSDAQVLMANFKKKTAIKSDDPLHIVVLTKGVS